MAETTTTTATDTTTVADTTTAVDTKAADTKAADTTTAVDTTAADNKVDTTKAADTTATDTTKAADAEVKYEFTAPDGFKLEGDSLESFTGLAKELKLAPENAQKALDLYYGEVKKFAESYVAEQSRAWNELQDTWKKELTADPELGGRNATEAQSIIGAALDEFGSPEARNALDLTGAGNNPHIARLIYNMAKALVEGSPTAPGGPGGRGPKTLGEALYGAPKAN